jgi:hypothetical protein
MVALKKKLTGHSIMIEFSLPWVKIPIMIQRIEELGGPLEEHKPLNRVFF